VSSPRILIACIGNIFLGDDAFGVEVARNLLQLSWPPSVHVEDFGIRGVDLAYSLLDNYDVAIFVDAAQRGYAPGTLFVIEPDLSEFSSDGPESKPSMDAHTMDPAQVLRSAVSMGAKLPRVLVVGCEPMPLPPDDQMQMELSPPVRDAVSGVVPLIRELVDRLLVDQPNQTTEALEEMSSWLPK
jgi:hydrogenase maturation protease